MTEDKKDRASRGGVKYNTDSLRIRSSLMREASNVVEDLKKNPDVSAVILFGSHATGKARPNSDVDIAVLLKKTDPDTEADVGSMYSDRIDLSLFHRLPLYIRFQVFKEGRLLHVRDDRHLKEARYETLRDYHEMEYYYTRRKERIMST